MRRLNDVEHEWIDSWTVEEAVAVWEFCELMKENLWRRHGLALCDEFVAELDDEDAADEPDDGGVGARDGHGEENLELPFEDAAPL